MPHFVSIDALGLALDGDKTTTGARCISSLPANQDTGRGMVRVGDKTTPCPLCKIPGTVVTGTPDFIIDGAWAAIHDSEVKCGCPAGSNRIIVPLSDAGAITQSTVRPTGQPSFSRQAEELRTSSPSSSTPPLSSPLSPPSESDSPTPQDVMLTVGLFFDGTGNNAVNTENMIKACTARHFDYTSVEAEVIMARCAREEFGVSGTGAGSYIGYYTNVHWLHTLYQTDLLPDSTEVQASLYIDGIGTEAGKPDSLIGQSLGIADTGVIAKTDKAVAGLAQTISQAMESIKTELNAEKLTLTSLTFDIFGFSRGAAAARHFANRVLAQDSAIIAAIRQGLNGVAFQGPPAGKTRFIGIFDTVAAIGSPVNGMNPHSASTGEVNITLPPGIAEKVFHITAGNECRFNFALNSVRPVWPELALPGAHSDTGGGYLPLVRENLFLTRPATETVPLSQPGSQTRSYKRLLQQLPQLDTFPCLAPVLRTSRIMAETWYDDRLPPDRYGQFQKRSFSALTLRDRLIRNDWAKVVLRVMIEAAKEAGAMFYPYDSTNPDTFIPAELSTFLDKSLQMGKAVRDGNVPPAFTPQEMNTLARSYIHCSANWNPVVTNTRGEIQGGAALAELISFVNRPDEDWRRTRYNMEGEAF
ncbi:PAAR domain-containing protein [Enterobacter bugandensis]|uniref:PAAR domain-containing protein n=1 Tax=Enterobacter bugandensis TaxID=881260 RepID=UPI00075184C4|nr:PAAR domain-containing protein [Enterobacter bugandensis]KUQ65825.1 type VI secretion protein [Enterobacter bugandensis]